MKGILGNSHDIPPVLSHLDMLLIKCINFPPHVIQIKYIGNITAYISSKSLSEY